MPKAKEKPYTRKKASLQTKAIFRGISDFKPAASRQRLKESGTSNNAVVRVVHYAHAVTHAVPVSVRAFACLGLTKTLRLHQQLLRWIAAARRPPEGSSPRVTESDSTDTSPTKCSPCSSTGASHTEPEGSPMQLSDVPSPTILSP
ncbi:hypothetical protein MRX96_035307 [Rhipicephalus microplus]